MEGVWSSRRICEAAEMERRMDPAKLPEQLRPFLPLFEKWGDVRSDTTRYALIDRALDDPSEMQELLDWHAKLTQTDLTSCQNWLEGPISPLEEHYEQAKVYFTYLLMYGQLEIEKR